MIHRNPGAEDDEGITAENHLWREVLHQALKDALTTNRVPEYQLYRRIAIDWVMRGLRGNCRDFVEVCDLAALHPEYVRAVFTREFERVGIL